MRASEFVRRIRDQAGELDRHYVLWLGAGCSVSSGIPAAAELVRSLWLPRLHHLKTGGDGDLDAWIAEEFPDYDPATAGALYGTVMDQLFPMPEDRQRETERLCSNRDPSFGYAVLAALMSRRDGILSTALTTNFDDLIADAMYVFGDRRPLVIEHDALAGFARPGRVQRPLVVKVHGDHRLNPMHTQVETAELDARVATGIRGLLQDRGAIFVGYSGNDRGVLHALEQMPDAALPYGVWWVSRNPPQGLIRSWLERREATWVQAGSFDELMLLFHQSFDIRHPTAEKFDRMVNGYRETYEKLTASVDRLPDSEPDSEPLKRAARRADSASEDWWSVELEARRHIAESPQRADEIYREGIARLEDPRLLVNYAQFLKTTLLDYDRAEEMLERAVAADETRAASLNAYANFVAEVRRDFERARQLYERALELDPGNETCLRNAARFETDYQDDHDRAEVLFNEGLAVPEPALATLTAFATFLAYCRGRRDRAEKLYEHAASSGPDRAAILTPYATFMANVESDLDEATNLFRRALEAEPDDVTTLWSFARFKATWEGDRDAAEVLFEQALSKFPHYSPALRAYGAFRLDAWADVEGARDLIERSLRGFPPDNPLSTTRMASLLSEHDGDDQRAEQLFEQALRSTPRNAICLVRYARFAQRALQDVDRAEQLYRRAIEANPFDATALSAYGSFLIEHRQDDIKAQTLLKRALAANPSTANLLASQARLLVASGQDARAKDLIRRAFHLPDDDVAMQLELWVYVLCLGWQERRSQALVAIEDLLSQGGESPGWNFEPVVERARLDGNPDVPWLEKLAAVIAHGEDPAVLDDWDKWPSASSDDG